MDPDMGEEKGVLESEIPGTPPGDDATDKTGDLKVHS